ncbi:MAG: hypothetical protein WD512_19550 [Candidatus Paceibacterota bacterium]
MFRKKKSTDKLIIDLTGQEGNAFVLLGYAKKLARQFGLNGTVIQRDMISGDYENLLRVFDKHFGNYVILER